MNNTFKIGETVVCTNAKRRWYRLGGLHINEMYTITGFNPFDGGLILKEVKSPGSAYHAFAANRFRKVDYSFAENILSELKPQPQVQPQFDEQLAEYEYVLSILN